MSGMAQPEMTDDELITAMSTTLAVTKSMRAVLATVRESHRASSLVDDEALRAKLKEELADVGYALLADCGDRPGHISRVLRIVDEHLGRGGR